MPDRRIIVFMVEMFLTGVPRQIGSWRFKMKNAAVLGAEFVTHHPNRSNGNPARNPDPDEIIVARKIAGLSQESAAKLIYSALRTWQHWESGESRMHPGLWELFNIKTGKKL